MEVQTLAGLMDLGKVVSVVGILIIIVWWLEKRMRCLEEKYDKEKDKIKQEYTNIILAMKDECSANLKAQRDAHHQEKSEFFDGLKAIMKELVDELQTAEKTRIKMIENLNSISAFQSEMRMKFSTYDAFFAEIKEILNSNGMLFRSYMKCELDEKDSHEFKRESKDSRRF